MPPVKKLTTVQKFAVIKYLAAFESPTDIVQRLQEEHGVSIASQSLYYYDPLKNESLPREYAELFYREREKFLRHLDAQAMQSLAYRQAQRLKLYQTQVRRNPQLASELLNDASQDSYRTAVPVAAPNSLPPLPKTREEREARIRELLGIACRK